MKRLNAETGKPFVRGDTRADGFLFWGYHKNKIKKDGFYVEQWCHPNAFQKAKADDRVRHLDKYYQNFESVQEYRQNNRPMIAAQASKRRADQCNRMPAWLSDKHRIEMREMYTKAKQISLDTGIPHEVDHIVPMRGKRVSGLHVPWNLQIIPATENRRKNNLFIV